MGRFTQDYFPFHGEVALNELVDKRHAEEDRTR